MLSFLPAPILALFSIVYLAINTLFWATPIFIFSFVKLVIPIAPVRRGLGKFLNLLASNWVAVNNAGLRLTQRLNWHVKGLEHLKRKDWYLVIANHQTWIDIVVLQKIFHNKVPFLKFFMKQELIWVPVLGLAWWALEFPFLKRYSKSYLQKNPHMKGKDLATTRKACEKFKDIPVAIMVFAEGTRLTEAKYKRQKPPFKHVLKPRVGVLGFTLSAMGEQLHRALNVSIYYPEGAPSLWQFVGGKCKNIVVQIEEHQISSELLGDYDEDRELRKRVNQWINTLWQEQDETLAALKTKNWQQET